MAISTDTVYQKVLAFANKEQRGYITPQEFNLFANQAQMEILDQYFYDINQFGRLPGNDTEYSDMLKLIDEKLSYFKNSMAIATPSGGFDLHSSIPDIYRLGSIFNITAPVGSQLAYEVNVNEFVRLTQGSTLIAPTAMRPIYTQRYDTAQSTIEIELAPSTITHVNVTYINKPDKVEWGYVVINERAMYNPSGTTDFQLHPLEEKELVYKILGFAGITLNKPGLAQSAINLESSKIQQEKQ